MGAFYILLSTVLIYIFFNTIVDLFIATKASNSLLRIKTKVFFHTYLAPIMFALVIFLVMITDNKAFNIFFGLGILLGFFIRLFSSQKRYLTKFHVGDEKLTVHFFTPFLKAQERQFNNAEIFEMDVTKANWLIDYPAAVNIKYNKDTFEFQILDKTLKAQVHENINAVNSSFPKKTPGQISQGL
jgi:hypothetical protein